MPVDIYIKREFKGINCRDSKIVKLVKAVCRRYKIKNILISIAVVDSRKIKILNLKFLRRKKNTDCLSFDLSLPKDKTKIFDIIVNGQLACKEAVKRGHSPQAELMLYITHGLLHNLGFDDHNTKDARKMHTLEDKILLQHGFGKIYDSNNIIF